MSEAMRLWVETTFNIVYLIVVWWIVLLMWQRRSLVVDEDKRTAGLMMLAFFFLGLGDIGHVGFRLIAFFLGGLETSVQMFGCELLIAPMGALATAITFTFFYIVMLMIWKERFKKGYGFWALCGFALAVARFLIMACPENNWNSLEIAYDWAIYRNVPLMLMQLIVAYLFMRDALAKKDRLFFWIAVLIFVSFTCYVPVIFLWQQIPLIPMLMIPKTIAYIVIAVLALRSLFRKQEGITT